MNRIKKVAIIAATAILSLVAKAEPVVLTYHDVKAKNSAQGDYYSVTDDELATQLQWLKLSGWKFVTLEEFKKIKKGEISSPEKAVLIMFDDAEKSTCNVVYPLLRTQKVPFTVAIVSSWIDNPTFKDKYCSWSELKELAKDPLVSFATHTHDLHKDIRSNKWGNRQPAAVTQEWLEEKKTIESTEEYRLRIFKDLQISKKMIFEKIGKEPQAVVWPYGWFNSTAIKAAKDNDFDMTFTLNNGSLDLLSYKRRLITTGTSLAQFKFIMNTKDLLEVSSRSLWLALSLKDIPEDSSEKSLSTVIDRLSSLDISRMILSDFSESNYSNRVVWQIKARLGIKPYLNIDTGKENFENSNILAEGAFVENCDKKASTSFTEYFQNQTVLCYPTGQNKKIKDLRFISGCENLNILAKEIAKSRLLGISDFILPASVATCPVLDESLKKEISK